MFSASDPRVPVPINCAWMRVSFLGLLFLECVSATSFERFREDLFVMSIDAGGHIEFGRQDAFFKMDVDSSEDEQSARSTCSDAE